MKISAKIATVLLLSLLSSFGASAQETDDFTLEVNKMIEVMNPKQVMITTMIDNWKNTQTPITDPQAAANAIVEKIWPSLLQDYQTIYRKYFTLEDMKNLNEFYASETGKKFSASSPLISAEINNLVGAKYQRDIIEILTRYIQPQEE